MTPNNLFGPEMYWKKISMAIFEEFENKHIPVDQGLAALTDCFINAYVAAEVPLPEFMRICALMIEIVQAEEEIRKTSQK